MEDGYLSIISSRQEEEGRDTFKVGRFVCTISRVQFSLQVQTTSMNYHVLIHTYCDEVTGGFSFPQDFVKDINYTAPVSFQLYQVLE